MEERLQSRIRGKKDKVKKTKEQFKDTKVPEFYPQLTRAAVMLSSNVHLMDSYLKQMEAEMNRP